MIKNRNVWFIFFSGAILLVLWGFAPAQAKINGEPHRAVPTLPFAGIGAYAPGQESHQVSVINVEVPVRIYKGKEFLDTLTINDFEVLENGVPQKLQALYLINKGEIKKQEGKRDFMPWTARNHFLFFQITEYDPKIEKGIEHFFTNCLAPNDNLEIWTQVKHYTLDKETRHKFSNEQLAEDLKKIIRRDMSIGTMEYKSLIKTLKVNARNIRTLVLPYGSTAGLQSEPMSGSTTMQGALEGYSQTLQKLESIRRFDIRSFVKFAETLKQLSGENQVHFFYEKEYKPELSANTLRRIQSDYHDDVSVMGKVQDLFNAYHQNIDIDNELLAQVYADTGALFNFIFLEGKKERDGTGIVMKESSEDVFRALSDVAAATGGKVINTNNSGFAFEETSKISNSYYLLYYVPKNFVQDNTFKNIDVKVKDRDDLTILSKKGYFAR